MLKSDLVRSLEGCRHMYRRTCRSPFFNSCDCNVHCVVTSSSLTWGNATAAFSGSQICIEQRLRDHFPSDACLNFYFLSFLLCFRQLRLIKLPFHVIALFWLLSVFLNAEEKLRCSLCRAYCGSRHTSLLRHQQRRWLRDGRHTHSMLFFVSWLLELQLHSLSRYLRR